MTTAKFKGPLGRFALTLLIVPISSASISSSSSAAAAFAAGIATSNSAVSSDDELNALVSRWISLYSTGDTLDVQWHVMRRSALSQDGSLHDEFLERFAFDWPNRFSESKYQRKQQIDQTPPPSQGDKPDKTWELVQSQCINSAGETIIVSRVGSVERIVGPTLAAEHAVLWFRVSPWVVAKYLKSLPREFLKTTREDNRIVVAYPKEAWSLVFDESGDQISLVQVRAASSPGGPITESVDFSGYKPVEGLPFPLPGIATILRPPLQIDSNGKPRHGSGLVLTSKAELMSASSPDPKTPGLFEFEAPTTSDSQRATDPSNSGLADARSSDDVPTSKPLPTTPRSATPVVRNASPPTLWLVLAALFLLAASTWIWLKTRTA